MYVRKTQTLVDDIEHSVDRMRNNAQHQLKQDIQVEIGTPLHSAMREVIETALWRDAPDIKDKMPIEWCNMENQVSVKFEEEGKKVIRHDLETTETDKVKMPPKHSRWDTHNIPKQYWTPLVKDWLDKRNSKAVEFEEVHDMYKDIARQLVAFMGKHASLNTALKEMPELKLYVPDIYLEKIEMKVERTAPKPKATTTDDVEVDVEALTRAAIAHRITSANN